MYPDMYIVKPFSWWASYRARKERSLLIEHGTDEASSWYVADVHHTLPLHFQGHEILSQASQAQQSSEPDNEVCQCVVWYACTLRQLLWMPHNDITVCLCHKKTWLAHRENSKRVPRHDFCSVGSPWGHKENSKFGAKSLFLNCWSFALKLCAINSRVLRYYILCNWFHSPLRVKGTEQTVQAQTEEVGVIPVSNTGFSLCETSVENMLACGVIVTGPHSAKGCDISSFRWDSGLRWRLASDSSWSSHSNSCPSLSLHLNLLWTLCCSHNIPVHYYLAPCIHLYNDLRYNPTWYTVVRELIITSLSKIQ